MKYRETEKDTVAQKTACLQGLEQLIQRRQAEAAVAREAYAKDIFKTPEIYRQDLRELLGWPLTEPTPVNMPKVKCDTLSCEDGYRIYRMEIEILEGFSLFGLLFRLDGEEKRPLVIMQHGGLGTPEYLSGFYEGTGYYRDMCQQVLSNGAHAFAPQLILWDQERFGVTYDRLQLDARLKRLGSSLAAVQVFGISRILDYFETMDWVSDFGMIGLSYGGFFALHTAALDHRVKACICCSYFNTRDAYPWQDMVWFNQAFRFDDAEIACLIYPRHLCIEVGKEDTLFDYRFGLDSFETVKRLCKNVGTDWVDCIAYDGGHEFWNDPATIARLVERLRQ